MLFTRGKYSKKLAAGENFLVQAAFTRGKSSKKPAAGEIFQVYTVIIRGEKLTADENNKIFCGFVENRLRLKIKFHKITIFN